MRKGCPINCPDRNARCHIDCATHQQMREENERRKKERQEEIAVIVYQCEQKVKAIEATKNHKTWKRRKDK